MLPIGFFSHMVEPLVLSRIFNKIFELIDLDSFNKMKDIPSIILIRYFLSLFTEIKNLKIKLMITDLIMLLGSGTMTCTLTNPEWVPVS